MKKLLVLLSALALIFTLATAEGESNNNNSEMKCQNGKCSGDKNNTKCNKGSQDTKEAPKKGKCGQGKCG